MRGRRTYDKFLSWIRDLRRFLKFSGTIATPAQGREVPENERCPYCILDGTFLLMRKLAKERLICGHCGHIVIRGDGTFKCPCVKCVEIDFAPRFREIRKK